MKRNENNKRTHTLEYWATDRPNGERFYSRTFAQGKRDLADQIDSIVKNGCYQFRIWDYTTYKKEKGLPA